MQPESTRSNRWPAQIKYIVGNEACERFSYYGMTSILAGYISGKVVAGGLGQTEDTATTIIHTFKFANYFMPLFGAWLSDRLIGRYHTILWVSLFYCLGHGVLAYSDFAGGMKGRMICLLVGLGLIAFGSGGIKPCVSAFMGDQFRADQGHLLQKAYGAFYWSINFGSFFSFLIIPWIKNHHGYSLAFGVPGILMALATFIFWLGTKHYVRVPPSRETKSAGFVVVFLAALKNNKAGSFFPLVNLSATLGLPLLAMVVMTVVALKHDVTPFVRFLGWASLILVGGWYALIVCLSLSGRSELPDKFWQSAHPRYNEREIGAARSVGPILLIFGLVPIFWSLFDQTTSTWVMQGFRLEPFHLFGSEKLAIGAEQLQSANPLLVMILVPVLTLMIYPRMGRLATPLRRMSFGMFLASFSYVVVAMLQARIEAGAQMSVLWQIAPYIVLTTAEVLVSTTGLEFAFREAAAEMKSTIMSFWLLTVAFGNLLVTTITSVFSQEGEAAASVSTSRFLLYAGVMCVGAILFSAAATRYRYRDLSAAEGK